MTDHDPHPPPPERPRPGRNERIFSSMSDIIELLQRKYPEHNIKYLPQSNCGSCKGRGEHKNKYGWGLCICTCVGLEGIGGYLKEFVDKELKEIRTKVTP